MTWWRRPLLRGGGRSTLSFVCSYELVALWHPRVPTITELTARPRLVWRIPGSALALTIVVALIHHFFIERAET